MADQTRHQRRWPARRVRWLIYMALGAVFTNSYLAGYLICGDCLAPLALLNNIDYLVLVGGMVWGALALVGRPRWVALAFLPSLVAFGWWYGPHFWPRNPPDPQGTVIRVATYNMQGGGSDPDAVFDAILALDADVIGMQEVGWYVRSKLVRLADADYPYRVFWSVDSRHLGLISRYPILEQQTIDGASSGNDPSYIRAVLDVEGQAVAVYVFHAPIPVFGLLPPRYDDSANLEQTRRMAGIVGAEDLPALVLCDCNATPRSRAYAVWQQVGDDAFLAAGRGFGTTLNWSTIGALPFPLIRIDYVWHADRFVPLLARVIGDTGTSDHHPLIVELDLRP